MDMSSAATTAVIQSLRNAGMRPTIPRIAVYQIVASMEPAGIGAEQLLDALPARGFPAAISTVYRTITELESLGLLVRSQDAAGRRVYLTDAFAESGKIYFRQGPRGKLRPVVDPALHEHLNRLAQQQGMDWRGKSLVVQAGD
ncbi:Fur family transcriptional regulator [Diaphorobacter caeni]|uniref:Fur family transcriptional regulator n=1 Tax=Diaphorobacter caeni TaxID=2784387 RepID=UPI00188EA6AE|nr:transcriptional repressor [Diaphorobacter caeni]MBF5004314.1 transcriptional repressor [Diaphorobacter caeni]